MTPEEIQALWRENPRAVARAFAATLKDFLYPVDQDYVQAEMERLYAGGAPRGGPSMFLARWIKGGVDCALG